MLPFRWSLPTALSLTLSTLFLWLGCSSADPDGPQNSASGTGSGPGSGTGNGGTRASAAGASGRSTGGATSGSPPGVGDAGAPGGGGGSSGTDTPSDPAWFADCELGEIRGSCTALDDSGKSCVEFPTTGVGATIDIPGTCGPERVRDETRCGTENAVAVCVSSYWRVVIYDREEGDAVSKTGVCKRYCSDGGVVPTPECDAFLACVCGTAEPQDGDSAACLEAREHVASIVRDFGAAPADVQCTQLLAMTPTCKDE